MTCLQWSVRSLLVSGLGCVCKGLGKTDSAVPGMRVTGDEADLMIGDESSGQEKFCQFWMQILKNFE